MTIREQRALLHGLTRFPNISEEGSVSQQHDGGGCRVPPSTPWVAIPRSYFALRQNLGATAHHLLGVLVAYSANGYVDMRAEQIAAVSGFTTQTVNETLRKLVKAGMIQSERAQHDARCSVYRVVAFEASAA